MTSIRDHLTPSFPAIFKEVYMAPNTVCGKLGIRCQIFSVKVGFWNIHSLWTLKILFQSNVSESHVAHQSHEATRNIATFSALTVNSPVSIYIPTRSGKAFYCPILRGVAVLNSAQSCFQSLTDTFAWKTEFLVRGNWKFTDKCREKVCMLRSKSISLIFDRLTLIQIALCSWARHFTLALPLSTQGYTV